MSVIGIMVTITVIAGVTMASSYLSPTGRQITSFRNVNNQITTNTLISKSNSSKASTYDSSTQITISNPFPIIVSSNPIPGIYLSVHLSLNATLLPPGGRLSVEVSDYNTLETVNSLNQSYNWAIPSILDWWPCQSTFIFSIYRGYYVSSNITGAVPLPLSPPGYSPECPNWTFSNLQFNASSNIAYVIGGPLDGRTISVADTWGVVGYFSATPQTLTNGSSYSILPFTQGTYTVVGGDEWGNYAISYFQVI